jgi:hypothetical protein
MEEVSDSEVDVKAGPVSFRAKSKYMAEIVAAASLTGVLLLGYVLYQHDLQTQTAFRDISSSTKEVFRDLSLTNKAIVSEMRMQTCLASLNEAERKAEYVAPWGFCKRMAQ